MRRRSISVAMIVKDEADRLGPCLSSLASIAGEVCIVDTGSRDNTPEIARQLGARVNFFPWCDDFSAARNESLRHCTGDWLFVVDADERMAAQDAPKIRALAEGSTDCAYRFVTRNYTNRASVSEFHPCGPEDSNAHGFAGWFPSVKVRFFPNREGVRFEGRVHETVRHSLEAQGIRLQMCAVPIHHYPFEQSPERVQAKQELYLRLGNEKVRAHPDDANAYAELGAQYVEVGDYANAAGAYREAVKRDPADPAFLKDLGGVLHLLNRNDEAERALELCLKMDPGQAEAWRNLGVVHVAKGAWARAVACFERSITLEPSWTDGYGYLAAALEGHGRLEEAAAAARRAVEAAPSSPQALQRYVALMMGLKRTAEAGALVQSLLDEGVANPGLKDAFDLLSHGK